MCIHFIFQHAAFEVNVVYLSVQQVFTVSERSEQQVRFLCAGGSGVWTSCRLDPILRLFDWSTGRPLQEVDFTALVTKTLGTQNHSFFYLYCKSASHKIMFIFRLTIKHRICYKINYTVRYPFHVQVLYPI